MTHLFKTGLFAVVLFGMGMQTGAARSLYLTASNTISRTLALGSTFIAREDRVQVTGNPACVTSTAEDTAHVVRVQLNPLLPFILLRDLGITGSGDYRVAGNTTGKLFASLGSGLRGVSYEHDWLRLQLSLLEALPLNVQRMAFARTFSAATLFENHVNSFLVNIRLARSIALGLTTSLYYVDDNDGVRHRGGGICYGILLKPSERVHVGLAYYNFPDQFPFIREPLERLGDETIHGGISYLFGGDTRVSLDIRNMTDDLAVAPRELHLGVETSLFRLVSLRGGFYNQAGEASQIYSCGAGVYRDAMRRLPWLGHSLDALDYSLLYESARQLVWHAFTVSYTL